jgi:hypothetical protein
MSTDEQSIDFTLIAFPSDSLTISTVRKAYPYSFDLPDRNEFIRSNSARYNSRKSIEDALGGLINFERIVASLAFKKALGLPLSDQESDFKSSGDSLDFLAEEYVLLALAAGPHEARELIKGIESQATAQARLHLPDPPPR